MAIWILIVTMKRAMTVAKSIGDLEDDDYNKCDRQLIKLSSLVLLSWVTLMMMTAKVDVRGLADKVKWSMFWACKPCGNRAMVNLDFT